MTFLHVSALEEYRTLTCQESRKSIEPVCYYQVLLLGALNVKDYGGKEKGLANFFLDKIHKPPSIFFFKRVSW